MPSPPTPHTPLPVWAWSPLSHHPHSHLEKGQRTMAATARDPKAVSWVCSESRDLEARGAFSLCSPLPIHPHLSSLCFFLPFSSLVPSPLPPHQMHSFLWPDHKEASSKDKGSPGTEQEALTVAFSKGGRHPPTLAASTLLAPAARGGTGAKTP